MKDLYKKKTDEDVFAYKYAVIVRGCNGEQRGYIVSVEEGGVAAVMEKLARKIDLDFASQITVAMILLEEDEF